MGERTCTERPDRRPVDAPDDALRAPIDDVGVGVCDALGSVGVVLEGAEGAVEWLGFAWGGRKGVGLPLGGAATDQLNVDLVAFQRCTEKYFK